MEVQSTMTTITTLEDKATATLLLCSPTVITYMELIRSGDVDIILDNTIGCVPKFK